MCNASLTQCQPYSCRAWHTYCASLGLLWRCSRARGRWGAGRMQYNAICACTSKHLTQQSNIISMCAMLALAVPTVVFVLALVGASANKPKMLYQYMQC